MEQDKHPPMEPLGQCATRVVHELNNHLLVIAGRLAFALDELPGESPVRAHLEEARRATSRASAAARHLLGIGSPGDQQPELPLELPPEQDTVMPAQTTPTTSTETSSEQTVFPHQTALVVDDEASIRSLVQLMLRDRGIRIIEARHGPDALLLAEIQHEPIDLLITDVAMPEMSGVELAKQMREHFPNIRVLYMSGYAADGLIERESLPSDATLIQKPFGLTTLVNTVQRLLAEDIPA